MSQLVGTGVKISIGYPLDTDTPGFANENLTKVDVCPTCLFPSHPRLDCNVPWIKMEGKLLFECMAAALKFL